MKQFILALKKIHDTYQRHTGGQCGRQASKGKKEEDRQTVEADRDLRGQVVSLSDVWGVRGVEKRR